MDLRQIAMLRKGEVFFGADESMSGADSRTGDSAWCKLGVLLLAVSVIGLPINSIFAYALLLFVTFAICFGAVIVQPRNWIGAIALVALCVAGRLALSPPPIQEGHNVFLPSAALEGALPKDVYRQMLSEFDAQYPQSGRCSTEKFGCWRNSAPPDSLFAFSADSLWRGAEFSRLADGVNFSDPIWLRLGFVNDLRYNWTSDHDVTRGKRDRRFWMGWRRWQLTMPWFEMIRLPAAYIGGELCWRGTVMSKSDNGKFSIWPASGCRRIQQTDADRPIFGIAIVPDSLAMHVLGPWHVRLRQVASKGVVLAGLGCLAAMLLQVRWRRMVLPSVLVAVSILTIGIADASFLGGVRPFDGGDDGLFYDGLGRELLQHLVQLDFVTFLRGGEDVFYYGGPGLRYFRAIEHVIFGESYFGYLTLVLLLPLLVFRLCRLFLPHPWSTALTLIFTATPIGVLFGTSFMQYAQLASRGFADPAAYILAIAGIVLIVSSDRDARFGRAFFGALLLVLGVFVKPIVAPSAAVLLAGAGLIAICSRQFRRVAGLALGSLPVFSMALHNWVFGHALVLFSANAADSNLLVMPPAAYAGVLRDAVMLDFGGEYLVRFYSQVADWLSGPAESYATIPLNAAGVGILLYVVICGRRFDWWLRLIGASALAQHMVAFFYTAATARYHLLTWFLTMLVVAVWFEKVGLAWFQRQCPAWSKQFVDHPLSRRLASGLARLQNLSS
ncbi:MAG TPA: hypothetical protein VFP60_11710 [Pseudolabrys sp.]|nr:hypothetical protein [Pseudolabrys sp.]